ncbi:MAG: hypothetical protein ACQEXJ_20530 [Myxococcota bacterium]
MSAVSRVDIRLRPGDTVTIERVSGWLEAPLVRTVPPADPAGAAVRFLGPLGAGFLVFSGLLSLALGLRRRDAA